MSDERRELSEVAAELARRLVAEQFSKETVTLEQMEEALTQVKRQLGEHLQRAWIEQQEPPEENQAACACGGSARFHGTRERTLVTRHGEVSFSRRYYHCRSCRHGFAPRDRELGLDGSSTSLGVRVWVAHLASDAPFAQVVQQLAEFTDVRLSESTAARIAREVGSRLRGEEQAEAQRVLSGEAVPRRTRWQPRRGYVSLDGTMTPLREEWKRDGSLGALRCRYGECKTAVFYETRTSPGGAVGVSRRQYTATLEPVASFEKLVAGLAYHCGSDQAAEIVCLADGLPYNWRIASDYFPEAIQILDYYHATQHLHTVAQQCLGEGTELARQWVSAREQELGEDQVAAVLTAIRALPAESEAARECRAATAGYVERNAERMRYGTFRAGGYQIASGVMEAACKTVVHQRLDQSGMHWRTGTAEAVVALRANRLSDQPRSLRPYCVGWS